MDLLFYRQHRERKKHDDVIIKTNKQKADLWRRMTASK